MARRAILAALAALVARAAGVALSAELSALSGDSEWKERPITRVVNLLKDMEAQLGAEAKEDEEMYDKMACWCETNDKEKTKAIADGNQKIMELSSRIEEAVASSSTLEVDIQALQSDTAKLQKALAEAEGIRAKESAEFNAEQKDMLQSVGSLKSAVRTMSKTQGGSSALQREALLQVGDMIRRRPAAATAAVAPHQRDAVRKMLGGEMSLLQEGSGLRTTTHQADSGAIFGILSQMKESFETNMVSAQKEEEQAASEYAELKTAKSAELKAASDKAFTKANELAQAKETAAQSKEDLEDTRTGLAADTEFLTNLKPTCANIDNTFEQRRKARLEEQKGISDTIGILTDDDAKDALLKTSSLVQLRAQSRRESAAREQASAALARSAERLRSPRLAYLAVRMRIDAFAKVRENIDKMAGALEKEKGDEVVKKDGCVTDINTNEKQTGEQKEHKEDKDVEIADTEAEVKALAEEQAAIKEQIAAAQVELKKASENRETENKDFQDTISDQRATQAILKKALERMSQVYAKQEAAALLQVMAHTARASQTPPGNFGKMEKNAGGTGVIALLETIIDESKEVEEDGVKAENEAQVAYETFVKDTNDQLAALGQHITNDSETIAKEKVEEVADKADSKQSGEEVEALGEMAGTLHGECDFTVNNFDSRQKGRQDEIDALKESKTIFSGIQTSLAQTGTLPA